VQAKAAANLILNLSSDDPAASWALYGELQVLAAAHPGEDELQQVLAVLARWEVLRDFIA
jgi:hypothetical protein